jgi:beta-glucosidase
VISSAVDQAVAAAKKADTAVVVVGSNPFINGREAHDRTSLALGDGQEALVRAVRKANPHTVVVLQTSYPDTITWEQQHVPGIVWTTHAGAETGHGIADVLYGDYNPAGRLTQTWPASAAQLPPDLNDYDIISSDQTYLYSRQKPLYPFGFGLSYSSFRYGSPVVGGGKVRVTVTNTGRRAGDEVVQLYTHQRSSRDAVAVKQLRGFQRVHLKPGRTATVTLPLSPADLAHWDVTRGRWVTETSVYDVMIGASSSDIRARTAIAVRGETIPARNLDSATRAETFDAYAGTTLLPETPLSGTVVGSTAAGQWISFKDVQLRDGRTFSASALGSGTVEVRLDSPSGRLLGTANVSSAGYATATASLARTAGRHDIYLVFGGPGIRLATFSIR